ncbi:MAG: glycosyltransferase family 4 protein [Alphaproteobacteria bacterium]
MLVFLATYLPGYKSGGPVRTIEAMVEALGDRIEFLIATSDRDSVDNAAERASRYPGIEPGRWYPVGKAQVTYIEKPSSPVGILTAVRRLIGILNDTRPDLVYLNSFFDPAFSVGPMVHLAVRSPKTRVLIAPRGEFDAGALGLKARKKRLFLSLVRKAGLYRTAEWHASTDLEADNIRWVLAPRSAIHVACDITRLPPVDDAGSDPARGKAPGTVRLCFLARISPKKNLHTAIKALEKVEGTVVFDVFGPDQEADYAAHCRALAEACGAHVTVRFRGSVPREDVLGVLQGYHGFLMPTLGENFGHSIIEAMHCGVPVIIGDTTPWRGLAPLKAGFDVPPQDLASVTRAVQTLIDQDAQTWLSWSRAARNYAGEKLCPPRTVEACLHMFQGLPAHDGGPRSQSAGAPDGSADLA